MGHNREIISTTEAPGAVGPYSQAVATAGMVFTAGQIPINPSTGEIEAETIEDQTRQVLRNILFNRYRDGKIVETREYGVRISE